MQDSGLGTQDSGWWDGGDGDIDDCGSSASGDAGTCARNNPLSHNARRNYSTMKSEIILVDIRYRYYGN